MVTGSLLLWRDLKTSQQTKLCLKDFFHPVQKTQRRRLPPADAIPVPVEEEPFIIATSFYAGPFDGVFPYVDSMKKELELLNALGDNAEMYLSVKFSKLNAKEYSEKLSVQQKEAFFRIYGKYLPEPLAEAGDVQKVIEYYHEQA